MSSPADPLSSPPLAGVDLEAAFEVWHENLPLKKRVEYQPEGAEAGFKAGARWALATPSPASVSETERLREACRPFLEALSQIDDDTLGDMQADDSDTIEDAFFSAQQPTVGDLRRLKAALQEPRT